MNTLQGWGVRKPTKNMFHGTFMMSLFQIAGHVFSSMAIARVPVSTVHTIKVRSLSLSLSLHSSEREDCKLIEFGRSDIF